MVGGATRLVPHIGSLLQRYAAEIALAVRLYGRVCEGRGFPVVDLSSRELTGNSN
jgi:hypothetical protein